MRSKKVKRLIALTCAAVMTVSAAQTSYVARAEEDAQASEAAETELKLRYSGPAEDSYTGWEQWSLPLGNSGIGASVFGGVTKERIQLNEKSLWSGGPAEGRDYNGGNLESKGQNGETMKQIQQLFAEGKTAEASNLCNQLVGVSDDAGVNGYGYYLSYGNMYLNFDYGTDSTFKNYERTLDLRTAVAGVEYDVNGVHYTRENFVSYPDNVLVTRITADSAAINVTVDVQPDNEKGGGSNNPSASSYTRKWNTTVKDGKISISGTLDDNQMKFASHTQVLADGTVTDNDATVSVAGAKTVTIITSIGTDYKNEYPEYRTGENDKEVSARVENYVTKAADKSYAELKADHIADYDEIFGRVELDLGQEVPDKTTNELLNAYKSGSATAAEKRYLEVMLFQYGRFLTIQSSRETPEDDPSRETLPSNLQGIWVGANNSAWHSDYHMNVNLQMNYWPTYSTNMAECAIPLINYVDSLREPGRVTAAVYAGIVSDEENPENGFMAHTQNNPFGWTCPGWSFSWGWSPAAVPWILQNCWEYYEYTGDVEFMEEYIYPMMKEEATLYDQMLVEDENGELVSSPSYSPEHGPYTAGNTYEQTLIWQLYEDTITAAELLGKDEAKVEEWKENQANLKGPIEIGDDGQIKEWYNETTLNSVASGATSHRHMSHLLGLFPGDLVSFETPEWLEAAKVSLANRMDKTTGWGMGQRINSWARVGDGNHAYKLIGDLFDSGILTNLWDTHSPYQIDGNFGYTSGVAEMLLQSNVGYINLLPALPDAWADGSVEGLVARGNFEVSMTWADGTLEEAEILSKNGGECVVNYPRLIKAQVFDENGKEVEFEVVNATRISFDTEEGKTYTIKNIPEMPEAVKFDQTILAENAMSNSEQWPAAWTNDGKAAWAFDDEAHWWHSRYQNFDQKADHEIEVDGKPSETNPIWIQTGFDQVFEIDHIEYTPRGTMGIFKDYTVSVANLEDPMATPSDSDFKVIKTGTLSGGSATQTIQLDQPEKATHVRITVTSVTCSGDGHVAAKKIDIYGALTISKEGLQEKIREAESLVKADYAEESWSKLEAALEAAKTVNENAEATIEEIDLAEVTLDLVIKNLKAHVEDVFEDVTADAWYTDAIQYVYNEGIMSGYNGAFTPQANMSRAMVVTTLYRMEGSPKVKDYSKYHEFTDVEAGDWYKDAVAWALNEEIATGDPVNKKFNPNADVTREQLAAFLYRYTDFKGDSVEASGDLTSMKNADKVSNWALKEMKWAVGEKLISGIAEVNADNAITGYDLAPQGNATRAQMATILQRYCK